MEIRESISKKLYVRPDKFYDVEKFSPVVTHGVTTANKKSIEYREWWREQFKRCRDGFTVDGITITGMYYFYLNFWKIRGRKKGSKVKGYINPRFLDMDYEFFWEMQIAWEEGYFGMTVLKCRQKGFSEKAAAITAWYYTFLSNSQSIIVAGEDKYTQPVFDMVDKGLDQLHGTELFQKRLKQKDPIRSGYKIEKDKVWTTAGKKSEIWTFTSGKGNQQVLIGRSPTFVYFEESGAFPLVQEVFNYIKPAMMSEGMATGFGLFVGTGGEMDKGVKQFEELFRNPEGFGLKPFDNVYEKDYDIHSPDARKVGYFVPAWKFLKVDENGNSLKEESIKELKANRELARLTGNPSTYHTEVTQFPFYPSEALMASGGNIFNIPLLNERMANIKNSKEASNMVDTGRLEWVKDEDGNVIDVEFILDDNGYVKIIEHPELDESGNVYRNLYIGGTDSYDRDETAGVGSKGSCQIFKTFLDADSTYKMFVARITTRPKTAEEFYEMTAKLMFYYGKAINLIEYSNLGIFTWYKQNELEYLLKERPAVAYANVKESRVQNKYGIDPQTKEYWITSLRDYIEKNVDHLYDLEQIEAFIKYRDDKGYNCDITISSSLCIVHSIDNYNIKTEDSTVTPFNFKRFRTVNGKITRV